MSVSSPGPAYAELHALSNFSFLRGASHPEELIAHAAALGYAALALTDECSLAGIVRAHVAAKARRFKLIVGAEFRLADGPKLALLATDRQGYGNLSKLITRGRRRSRKGAYHLVSADLEDGIPGCLALLVPRQLTISSATTTAPDRHSGEGRNLVKQLDSGSAARSAAPGMTSSELPDARWLAERFPGRAWIAVELLLDGNDRRRLGALQALGRTLDLPLVAAGDVHMHVRSRRVLQDTLTAIRLKATVAAAGHALFPNSERHLRRREAVARLYPPPMLAETLAIAERCQFSLDELRYEYPQELVPAGETPTTHLRHLTEAGLRQRYPAGTPAKVRETIERELTLIAELRYEAFFLTVHDIVAFARSRHILCQGRGSAANSAVCYALQITEVDPARADLLFERFVSRERNEPPDIDVDFEHERREEVIQYVYEKYGRERAALAATVITYQPRSAVRDIGKALGMEEAQVTAITRNLYWWDDRQVLPERLREQGLEPDNPLIRQLIRLAVTLIGFPRHLSQHVGGFVIARDSLADLVPIENAAMPSRTVIQWDKDDLEALGLLKVDCLALGMLSAIRRAFDLVNGFRGGNLGMATVPAEDPQTYAMIRHADTIGVFQIESRAQMAMLPRLKPEKFYDLVIEIAIVRPGPIQGEMVHPYLRRREGKERITYPSPAVEAVLKRTLGVPLFQEQVIKLAMVAAGFTPGEADQLRRSMASWRRNGNLEKFKQKLIDGMRAHGYEDEFAERIYQQILGFGEYGFPESHSASFALLAYVSAWLKCHEPAAFTCALLNSQPMGFYLPSQLVQDARRHDVEVRPVDVTVSMWDCTLERRRDREPAIRLGLRMVKGLAREAAQGIIDARAVAPFREVTDLSRRAELARRDIDALAAADALASLAGNRHQARWRASGVEPPLPLLSDARIGEATPLLRPPSEGENIVADYASVGLTLRRHPLALLRPRLRRMQLLTGEELKRLPHGTPVVTSGIVTTRQRPGTATGVVFLTLEDETGQFNVVVWSSLAERYRRAVVGARLLIVQGEVQREGEVLHVIARLLRDGSALLGELTARSRDFH
ncbi:MAG: error-prone DNA polymerase [Chromatiales bacterium]